MKGIKRASHFLKQYFVFSRTERKGIYALLFLIILSLSIPRLWAVAFPPEPLVVSITNLPEEIPGSMTNAIDSTPEQETHAPFIFDPNTADSLTLASLGFSPKVTRSMLNYRSKGGRFRKAEELYKIYHVDSDFVTALMPYVQIRQEVTGAENKASYQSKPEKIHVVVEINTADSAALVGLFGIGPKTASRIIEFRTRSGGFFAIEQLTDVYGISPELLVELQGKITVDPSRVKYLDINTVTYEELRQHPYLRYKTASAIINYRKQHGAFKSADELKKVVVLHDSVYRKIEPYIKTE